MEPQIIEKAKMTLIGLEYFGPLSGEGWSAENTIGQLWIRFEQVWIKRAKMFEGKIIKPEAAYELGIWNEEEFQETKNFYIFIGVEVDLAELDDIPLEFVIRVLPASTYACFTAKGKGITTWENDVYNEWLPQSGYTLATFHDYNFQIQSYEQDRFKGPAQLEESEIDIYIPVTKKA